MFYTIIISILSTYFVCKYVAHRSIHLHRKELHELRDTLVHALDYTTNVKKQGWVQEITHLLSE